MKNIKSIIFVLIAGCMWGCMGLLVRPLNNAVGLETMDIVALRAFETALLTCIGMPVLSKLNHSTAAKDFKVKISDLWVFVGTGIVSVVFFNFCYFNTIIYTSLSVAAIMLYTAPIFVMIISAVVFKDKMTVAKVIALVLAFAGCAVVTGAVTGKLLVSSKGILYGLGAGIGYALYSIFGKFATDKGYNSATVTLYTFLFASIGVLPFIRVSRIVDAFVASPSHIVYTFFMIILTTFLPYIFYTAGLAGMEPGKAAVVACIEPVMATFVGLIVFGEKISIITYIGVALVIGAIVLINNPRGSLEKKDL